jgi:acyl-CoA thioesterase YciA
MSPYIERETVFFDPSRPRGELAARTLAMPADTNPAGDIFGGWIMSMMDSAGAITATRRAEGRVVTAAVTHISFMHPVKVGDVVCCYTDVVKIGRSSIVLNVEVWVLRQGLGDRVKVTEAEFTFVALGEFGEPRPLKSTLAKLAPPKPKVSPKPPPAGASEAAIRRCGKSGARTKSSGPGSDK